MSIVGVGIDIADVARFRRMLERRDAHVLDRWLSSRERTHVRTASDPAAAAAGIHAMKEAVWKALGVADWDGRVPWAGIDTAAPGGPRLSGEVRRAAPAGVVVAAKVQPAGCARIAVAIAHVPLPLSRSR